VRVTPGLRGDKMPARCRGGASDETDCRQRLVVCGAVGGCTAHNAQGKAAAPIGSWLGTVVAFDLGSDGHVSYKDPGVAEFTGRWEWLPTTQDAGNLVLTPSAPN
jgi:hypothetical protein